MKRTSIFLVVCCLAIAQLQSQTPRLSWADTLGSLTGGSIFNLHTDVAMVSDAEGNIYTVHSVNNQHVQLLKHTSSGTLLWQKTITEGSGSARCQDIAVDKAHNLYLVGYFSNTVDFDPGDAVHSVSSNGSTDMFIQKLDSAGNLVWVRSIGGIGTDIGNSTVLDDMGNVYVTGYFSYTVDFDPGDAVHNVTSNGATDMFIQKLDSAGNVIWVRDFGGIGNEQGSSIVVDGMGNVSIVGFFQGTVDFDPGDAVHNVTSKGGNDIFVQKLDSAGNLDWVKSTGGINNDEGTGVYIDTKGFVYIVGVFRDTVDFDPGDSVYNLASKGAGDIFVQKLDSIGNLEWAKSVGGIGGEAPSDIVLDDIDNIYVVGNFGNTVDFDPGDSVDSVSSKGQGDIFVQKLDNAGNLVWVISIGGSAYDGVSSVFVSSDCGVYIAGYITGSVDVYPDAGMTYIGISGDTNYSAFVTKFKEDYTGYTPDTTVVSVCDSYDWRGKTYKSSGVHRDTTVCGIIYVLDLMILGENFDSVLQVETCDSYDWRGGLYTSSASYVDSVTSVNGCDSLYRLNLIVYSSDTTTDTVEACDSYVWHGNAFTSTGIRTKIETNIQGCDSLLHLDLRIQHSSPETRDTATACEHFIWRDSTYASTGVYQDSLVNGVGCDSILTLDLSIIDTVDTVVMQENSRLVARLEGGAYQWLDCGNSYAEITGATSRVFTATTNGEYAVEVRDVCIDTSSCYTIMGLSIEALRESQGPRIQVYPSPTEGELFIELGQFSKKVFVVVRDVFGRVLQDEQYEDVMRVNTRLETSTGMYYIEVLDDKGNRGVFRVIKR